MSTDQRGRVVAGSLISTSSRRSPRDRRAIEDSRCQGCGRVGDWLAGTHDSAGYIWNVCATRRRRVDQPYYMLSVGVKAPRNENTRIKKTPHSMRVDAQAPPLRLFKKDANCHAGTRRHSAKYHPTCSPPRSNHLPRPSRAEGEISIHHSSLVACKCADSMGRPYRIST